MIWSQSVLNLEVPSLVIGKLVPYITYNRHDRVRLMFIDVRHLRLLLFSKWVHCEQCGQANYQLDMSLFSVGTINVKVEVNL